MDYFRFELYMDKRLTPIENWVNSIKKFIEGIMRVRDMLASDLMTAIDFPTTFIVELLDIWYSRLIAPWIAYYHESSRQWLRQQCYNQWCNRVFEDYYYEDFSPAYIKLPAAIVMMCIHVTIVTMGIMIPW